MPVCAPKPKRSTQDASRPGPSRLGDRDRADVRRLLDDLLDGQPLRPADVRLVDHAIGDLDRRCEAERRARGDVFSCKPAAIVTSLNVDPGS